ncbi:MAG: 6-carboxytetrahydropterin synthase [Magnetococcales bacterium]|nr:6-carboxytetrahydropterin synthase [Magnetococcales bacterium]MBF0150201.1 6-carboxytetrahydropterin synthase [Magnetococcales bacterium]MBF0174787.1 6-carboxytetrahydropterin synthase [Magnetococcales bacterium]
MSDLLFLTSTARFEAARSLSMLPEAHRGRRLHGHGFVVRIRTLFPETGGSGTEVADLRQRLSDTVAPLDYCLLNDWLPQPTDQHLAHWVWDHLQTSGIKMAGIQSTPHAGADIDHHRHTHSWCSGTFESAHRLPHVPPGHPCGRMHGHGFKVMIHANRDLSRKDPATFDHDPLDASWQSLHRQLHGHCLNDIPGLENPTSEMIAHWIWLRLNSDLPGHSWVTVQETGSSGTMFDGTHYRIWKEFSLDSAVRRMGIPGQDPHPRIYGHTFTLRLHLTAPLDAVLGWTVDFGEVKRLFHPVFTLLDHHPLHERADLEQTDCASIARWIKNRTLPLLPQLDRIDLYETPGCGVILSCRGHTPALPV